MWRGSSRKMKTTRSMRTRTRLRPRRSGRSSVVTPRDIQEAADGLRGIARRTQLLWVEELGVHLKLENEQPIGAFKIRGAYNAIRKLPDPARKRGVITFSSGNHGQAVAFAAKQFGVRAVIVMPETTPAVKIAGVKKWGGEVVFAGRTSEDRRIKAEEIARQEQLAIVPPFDHPDIVAGQATVALEIVEQPRARVGCGARRRAQAASFARRGKSGPPRAHRQHRRRPDHVECRRDPVCRAGAGERPPAGRRTSGG